MARTIKDVQTIPRTDTAPSAVPVVEGEAFAFSSPVEIDLDNASIDDMVLFAEIAKAANKGKNDQAVALLIATEYAKDVRDMLDRVVVGGAGSRPRAEFFPLLREVMQEISNPKN